MASLGYYLIFLLIIDRYADYARSDSVNTTSTVLPIAASTFTPTQAPSPTLATVAVSPTSIAPPVSISTTRLSISGDQSVSIQSILASTNGDGRSIATSALGSTAAPSTGQGERSHLGTTAGTVNPTTDPSKTSASSQASTASTAPVATPRVGQEIVNGLVSSFVPGSSANVGNALGSLNLLPALSKISEPLAHVIASGGKPSPDDVNNLLKVVPDMAIMAGIANMVGGGSAAAKSNGAHSGSNGNVQSVISPTDNNPNGKAQSAPTDFTHLTQQQIADYISGAVPLPPLSAFPPEYVQMVMAGQPLPGLTLEQTQALKQRYMQQMFGGGGSIDSLFGHGSPAMGGEQSANHDQATNQQHTDQSIGQSVNQSVSRLPFDQSSNRSTIPPNTQPPSDQKSPLLNAISIQELAKLDLSQLPPDVVQDFLSGKTPDLSKIPQDFLRSVISKTPQLFANIVSTELKKKIANRSIADQLDQPVIDGQKISVSSSSLSSDQVFVSDRKSIPYDVNSLDRKADISMYKQHEDDEQARLWSAIILGVVGLLTVISIGFLCWRHRRNQRRKLAMRDQKFRSALEGAMVRSNAVTNDPRLTYHSTSVTEESEGHLSPAGADLVSRPSERALIG